jgi:hypothetical protein
VDGQDITGSTDGARITAVGNPKNFGNAGVGLLYGRGVNNWDLAVSNRFPPFSESRYVPFRQTRTSEPIPARSNRETSRSPCELMF